MGEGRVIGLGVGDVTGKLLSLDGEDVESEGVMMDG